MSDSAPARIVAIDWMRGLVMILMVVDHASMAFNGQHMSVDSAGLYTDGTVLPPLAFLSRWMTHLCAPTFVFLAGTALALSVEKRAARGENPWTIDRQILARGLIIAVLDPTLVSLCSRRLTFQVLYAIGVSMMLMAPLRRLPMPALILFGLGGIVLGEALVDPFWDPTIGWPHPGVAALGAAAFHADLRIAYPLLPWLSMMALGWAFGRYLVDRLAAGDTDGPRRTLLIGGVAFLVLFFVVSGANGYGNMFLLRSDSSILQWLLVSKYPPSIAFIGLELGMLGVCLAALIWIEPRIGVRNNGPILVFGQTAMFFYLVHRVTYETAAAWLGMRGAWGLASAWGIAAVSLLLLYPACLWYRQVKKAHPTSILRYF